jgi:methoxymalonate biosynthesis acyl carrier protein
MENEIALQLRTFIRQRFGIPESDREFTDNVDLFNYGYIDSFGAVDLHTFIADEFGIHLTDADFVALPNTIREISEFLAGRKKGKS